MKEQKQRVVDRGIGDCFAACMATLLELPLEVMPNDHSEDWFSIWLLFLSQFGLSIGWDGADGPIWQNHPWIASVKSKNYKGVTHAVIMDSCNVAFDPSTKKTYKKGQSLLGEDIVTGGWRITVSDFSKLHKLEEYRKKIAKDSEKIPPSKELPSPNPKKRN